jgi:hypothetical protein
MGPSDVMLVASGNDCHLLVGYSTNLGSNKGKKGIAMSKWFCDSHFCPMLPSFDDLTQLHWMVGRGFGDRSCCKTASVNKYYGLHTYQTCARGSPNEPHELLDKNQYYCNHFSPYKLVLFAPFFNILTMAATVYSR